MKNWERLEKKTAKDVDGTVVSGSGRGYRKGDVKTSDFLIENKETSKDTYSLSVDSLLKISQESLREHRAPAFVIEFGDGFMLAIVKGSVGIETLGVYQVNKSIQLSKDHAGYLLDTPIGVWTTLEWSDFVEWLTDVVNS